MKRFIVAATLASAVVGMSAFASESNQYSALKLSEIQLGSSESASHEYIEIKNTSVQPIDLDGVRLQYKSASGSSWSNKADLEGFIAPYGRYLISNYLDASQEFRGGLAGTSGHLQIVDGNDVVLDRIGWGEAIDAESTPTQTHGPDQSLKRLVDEDGFLVDTNDNQRDWIVSDNPSPQFDDWHDDSEADTTTETTDQTEGEDGTAIEPEPMPEVIGAIDVQDKTPLPSPQLNIVELLPDPVSPLTDADHEFVELHNPNDFPVELEGYSLESGSRWQYRHVLGRYLLAPNEFIALYSGDTGLTLSNSGSQVRLLGRGGEELDSVEYPKSKAGQSYANIDDEWVWVAATTNSANESTSSNGTMEDSNSEITKRDVPYTKSETDQAEETAKTSALSINSDEPPRANNWALAGVGLLAVLYALYEYRNDIRLRIQQYRRYIALRRADRTDT